MKSNYNRTEQAKLTYQKNKWDRKYHKQRSLDKYNDKTAWRKNDVYVSSQERNMQHVESIIEWQIENLDDPMAKNKKAKKRKK